MTKEDVIDLIRDAGYGVLATVDGNSPRARPMMPYLDDNGNLYLATFAQKRTVSQIKANPNVEMCFIDRRMNFARISGKAKLNNDAQKKAFLWDCLPMLKQYFSGPEDEGFVVIEIDTQTVEASTPQQQTPDVLSLK